MDGKDMIKVIKDIIYLKVLKFKLFEKEID
jgi:hypothetical protein